MSDHQPPTDPHLWEGLWSWLAMAGAAGTGLVAAFRGVVKRTKPDYEEMATAWFAAKEQADTEHRNAIVEELVKLTRAMERMCEKQDEVIDAIRESNQIVRDANEKTRERVADLFARALKL